MDRKSIRLGLVDDHHLFRASLKMLLEFYGFTIALEASDGVELLEKLDAGNAPDIILVDINMPRMNGLITTKRLREKFPATKVLICTMLGSTERLAEAMAAGARGYLVKSALPEELINAVEAVYNGVPYFSKDMMGQVAELLSGAYQGKDTVGNVLNDVEREVVSLIAYGKTTSDIARHLILSTRTVDGYKARIMNKLGVQTTVGMILEAVRLGILSVDTTKTEFHKINKPIS
jgi:DNA-binding NarL/FixJ family response regulator